MAAPAPRAAITLEKKASAQFAALFHAMLARGVYLPPSPYEVCFLSLAHTRGGFRAVIAAGAARIAGRGRGERRMKATRVFQIAALLIVIVAVVQVGWWVLDQHD